MLNLPNVVFSSLLITVLCLCFPVDAGAKQEQIKSPDNTLSVRFWIAEDGRAFYDVSRNGQQVLEPSQLGLRREDADFSKGLILLSAPAAATVSDSYKLAHGKRRLNMYKAVKRVFHLQNIQGSKLDIIFQVSNDGIAFRYYFPGKASGLKKILEEQTSFNFPKEASAWLQPMSDDKTGWEQTNPSYEEFYENEIPVGTPSPIKAGWVYPALFKSGDTWVLIAESFPDRDYCGTRLKAESPGGEYSIGFPQSREMFPGGALNPQSTLPWYSPWRIITCGSLKTIVESSLGTDLAKPAVPMDQSFIKPGKSSWSWVLKKDDSIVYDVQKRFIDFAADMNWEYCLIDVQWDTRIGYAGIKELADYGKEKGVGLILWYNSAGSWNTTPYTPKHKLLTREDRRKEFSRLHEIGIKGLKVDFFGGDGQSMMAYYQDILEDAATYKLLVNCHGSTLPRGLHRTYPNLVTMEAIKGMEFRTFDQKTEDAAAAHAAVIPFSRNVSDPMDYTPMVLHEIPNIRRSTSNGFELALPILFQSGIQHFAEIPEGMATVPAFVKDHIRALPSTWDDIRFIDGYPGHYVVLARRAGKRWFIAGINAQKSAKELKLDLSFLGGRRGQLISDGASLRELKQGGLAATNAVPLTIKPGGGFVAVFE